MPVRPLALVVICSGLAACQTVQTSQARYARADGRPLVGRALERSEQDRTACVAEVQAGTAGQPPLFFGGPVGAARAAVTYGLREQAKADMLTACMARKGYREIRPPV